MAYLGGVGRIGPRYGHGRPPHPGLTRLLAKGDSHYDAELGLLWSYEKELRRVYRKSLAQLCGCQV
jgi:hypothetical protein